MRQSQFNWLKFIKIFFILIAVLTFIFIVMAIYNYINSKISEGNLEVNMSKASITTSEASVYASRLYRAMAFFGTNEKKIIDVLNVLNEMDLRLVYNKFGKRYNILTIPALDGAIPRDLTQWFQQELDEIEPAYKLAEQRFKVAKIPWA